MELLVNTLVRQVLHATLLETRSHALQATSVWQEPLLPDPSERITMEKCVSLESTAVQDLL